MWQSMQEAGLPENLEDAKKRVRDSKSSSEGYAFIGDATDIRYQVRILYHMALEFFHSSSRIPLLSASDRTIWSIKKLRSIYLLRIILMHLIFVILKLLWPEFCQWSRWQQNSSRNSPYDNGFFCLKRTFNHTTTKLNIDGFKIKPLPSDPYKLRLPVGWWGVFSEALCLSGSTRLTFEGSIKWRVSTNCRTSCTTWAVKFVSNMVKSTLFLSIKWSTAPLNACSKVSIPLSFL